MKNNRAEPKLLHDGASSYALVFVLKFVFAIWLVRYLIDPLQQLSELPVEYTDPVGWLNLLPINLYLMLHSYVGLLILRCLIIVCCIGVWIPKYRARSALYGCLLITTAAAVSRGFGHLNHAELGPLLITWTLSIFAWRMPCELLRQPDHRPCVAASTGLVTATIVLSLVYALVGIARLCYGGISLLAGDTITNQMVAMSYHDWLFDYNFSQIVLANPIWLLFLKLGTAIVTVVEIAAPFCLINRRVRIAMLIVMPGFHVGAMFLFKVWFVEQALMLILFLNLTHLLASTRTAFRFAPFTWHRFWSRRYASSEQLPV